jgi:hypothetical protein
VSGFDAARLGALMADLLAYVRGRPAGLLSFDTVREKLRLKHLVDRGVAEVPLDRIVGSVGRVAEFNRVFLPRRESLRRRWVELERLAEGPLGFPPVDLYKVGDAYFVVDGHHRVSVARSLGAPTIEARIKEFLTRVPLAADASVRDVLLKEGLAGFLESTGLEPVTEDEYRVSVAAGYERLLEHISGHRYFRGLDTGHQVSWPEAVASWRDNVYRPMVQRIRGSGVMRTFPGRTETDLYLFTMEHLHHLRAQYGDRATPDAALRHLRWTRRASGRGRATRRSKRERA